MMIQPSTCPPQPSPVANPGSGLRLALLLALPIVLLFAGLEVVATPQHLAEMDPVVWLIDGPRG
jgi:hypothetical protein